MKYLFSFIALSVVLAGCQKTGQLTYTEKRLIGSWFYTDVDFISRWSIKKNDITKDYFGDVLTFNEDFTASYTDGESGTVMNGVWQVNQVSQNDPNTNGNSFNEQVIASYENDVTGEIIQLVWDNFTVRKTRIDANNSDKDGYYDFELKKF